jgi:kynurenine formamidase
MTRDARKLPDPDALATSPSNWGRWGPDDEVGSLNFLTPREVLRGLASVQQGRVFTLALQIGHPQGEPLWPGRLPARHFMIQDKGSYEAGKAQSLRGGAEFAEDGLILAMHGPTHCDGLAHTWLDDVAWNGFPANDSKSGLKRGGILPIAERGIVGHAVLLDVARFKGVPYLGMHTRVTLEDLLETAASQGVEIAPHDIIVVRTGIFKLYYEAGAQAFYEDLDEPGLAFDEDLVRWFHEMEIPLSGTDNCAGELIEADAAEGAALFMHSALSRNLGVVFVEAHWLEEWADDCARDGKYDGLYVASPLKIRGGTACPVNPIVVK